MPDPALAPEPLDAFTSLTAAIRALADEVESDGHCPFWADRMRALIPKPRSGSDG